MDFRMTFSGGCNLISEGLTKVLILWFYAIRRNQLSGFNTEEGGSAQLTRGPSRGLRPAASGEESGSGLRTGGAESQTLVMLRRVWRY